MVIKKIHKHIIYLFVIFCLSLPLYAQNWTSVTSQKDIASMRVVDDTLFCATSGGLLAITDPLLTPKVYLNTDGLGTNELTAIINDTDNNRWLTSIGYLIQMNQNGFSPYILFDNDNNLLELSDVVDDGSNLWVGTSVGLILFSKVNDEGQIEDSYSDFGSLNPDPYIHTIFLERDNIWLGTSSGMAVTDRTDFIQMKSPAAWTTVSMDNYPELSSDTVLDIISYQNNIYFTTTKNMFQFSVDTLLNDTTLINLTPALTEQIYDMTIVNDTLYLLYSASGSRIAYLINSTFTDISTSGLLSNPTTICSFDNRLWVSVVGGGLFYQEGAGFTEYIFTGLPGNNITDVTVSGENKVFVGAYTDSFARETDSVWENLGLSPGAGTTDLLTDVSGQVWLGTTGNGVWLVTDTGIINYDENNSTLIGNSDNFPVGLSYVYISGMASDGDYIYFACYRAQNGNPLVYADLQNLDDISGWGAVGISEGLSNTFTTSLDQGNGRVAIGTESDGVFECAVGNNPFTSSNDCRHLVRENSLLISNDIRVVKYDPDGNLWVGTNMGLSRYDPGIDFFVDVNLPGSSSTDITALDFDSRGNAWIGTKEGLWFYDIVSGEFTYYSFLNSDLVSDNIQKIYFNDNSGYIYVSTDKGFSVREPLFGLPEDNLEEVIAFPNPYVIKSSDDLLRFNYAYDAEVIIYSVAGEQIIQMPLQDWDGTNAQGEDVASGVYIFVLINDAGEIARGKILLIRQ